MSADNEPLLKEHVAVASRVVADLETLIATTPERTSTIRRLRVALAHAKAVQGEACQALALCRFRSRDGR